MTDLTAQALREFNLWQTRQQVGGRDSSPEHYVETKRMERILNALEDIFDVDAGLINHYFEEDDIEWIKTRNAVKVVVD